MWNFDAKLKTTIFTNLIQFGLGIFLILLICQWYFYPLGIFYEGISFFGSSIGTNENRQLFFWMIFDLIFMNLVFMFRLFAFLDDLKMRIFITIQFIALNFGSILILLFPIDSAHNNHNLGVSIVYFAYIIFFGIIIFVLYRLEIYRLERYLISFIGIGIFILTIIEYLLTNHIFFMQRLLLIYFLISLFYFQWLLSNDIFIEQINFFKD